MSTPLVCSKTLHKKSLEESMISSASTASSCSMAAEKGMDFDEKENAFSHILAKGIPVLKIR